MKNQVLQRSRVLCLGRMQSQAGGRNVRPESESVRRVTRRRKLSLLTFHDLPHPEGHQKSLEDLGVRLCWNEIFHDSHFRM
ncbi:hypothetical protein MPTK1_4g23390 [Marchantia polymorpha subsp. ruderalis]|uniref:Uncharacterized protein n=2 Tax=Marchantia polymorpha TaxID=3197 RepID=A0AAF6BCY6_MARPO|nr:hypothetical protein MARPO_0020s0102 [Marchantia polymorpha]BBN09870.1 hypothetical protein Mp_4g23390 [Marchantia polymorpha subsp. ruderalis]|eukprot:PTQ44447.1 hypothetical protein MARPO_0020s0102 [Marchantia polymorpha]